MVGIMLNVPTTKIVHPSVDRLLTLGVGTDFVEEDRGSEDHN